MPSRGDTIRVRRRMPAPRDVVYEAWTTAEGFRHWMCPGDVVSAEATLDVRVGGAFRIVMKSPSTEHVQTGIYEIVEPPAKLAFSWNSSNHPPTRGRRVPRSWRRERDCNYARRLHHSRYSKTLRKRLGHNCRQTRDLPGETG